MKIIPEVLCECGKLNPSKFCHRCYMREYNRKNKNYRKKKKVYQKQWKADNKEHVKEYHKIYSLKYYHNNPDYKEKNKLREYTRRKNNKKNKCDKCDFEGKTQFHHISYNPEVIQELCISCHGKEHYEEY